MKPALEAGRDLGSRRTVEISQVLTAVCHHLWAIDHSNLHTDGMILCHVVGWDLKKFSFHPFEVHGGWG